MRPSEGGGGGDDNGFTDIVDTLGLSEEELTAVLTVLGNHAGDPQL
jgi:hypothetical protein